jgi:uncharacterized membrane protein
VSDTQASHDPASLTGPGTATLGDLGAALSAGLRDFLRAPLFGLFFSSVYVAGGMVLYLVYAAAGQEWWLAPVAVGFPLFAPFAAVGLYEVSRRMGRGEPLSWKSVLGVVFAQKDRQVPALAAVILVIFLFWMFVAHAIFALFMGLRAFSSGTDIVTLFFTGNGPLMLLIGSGIGAGFALALYATTVVGLPMLLDREVDFVTAMITSVRAVRASPFVMLAWAGLIAVALFLAMIPFFLGLFVVLPVLGHATWHLYLKLLPPP